MAQQTAVNWLIDQLRQLSHSLEAHLGTGDIRVTQGMIDEFEEQAKQMEKEQIIDAVNVGFEEGCKFPEDIKLNNAEQYYNETFNKDKQ